MEYKINTPFINKVWNASKFISMHSADVDILPINKVNLSNTDQWLIYKLDKTEYLKVSLAFTLGVKIESKVSRRMGPPWWSSG